MLDKLKKLFGSAEPVEPEKEPVQTEPVAKKKKPRAKLTEKEKATQNKQPWHDVKLITNESDPRNGYFQMDWNSYHIEALRRLGYEGKTEEDVVEGWIRDISRSVALENEEILDYMARPRVQSKPNDDGTTEYS